MPSVIALDAMGSDRSPRPEVEGAIQAARQLGAHVLLVGQESRIRPELDRHRWISQLPIDIVHADEVITMEDKAAQAVRAKKQSSMHVGIRLVREGKAAGFVTAGNTGAAMAAAKMILGALPGVDRPALAAVFPTAIRTGAMLLDVGANVDCDAHNLEQFALMGEIYFRSIFGTKRPKVGLLSIGEEETKGNLLVSRNISVHVAIASVRATPASRPKRPPRSSGEHHPNSPTAIAATGHLVATSTGSPNPSARRSLVRVSERCAAVC